MDYNIYSLFSIPFFETTLEFSEEVVEYIHSLEHKRTDLNNADISVSKNVLDHPLFSDYSSKIDSYINEFVFGISKFDQTKLYLERVASWSNIHHPEDWAQEHIHNNSFVSGVWYLETPENCGDLDLKSPHSGFGLPIDYSRSESNEFNSHSWSFSPIKGKVYIFPSTLKHSVFKNESKDPRSSIAFNYYARGVLTTEDKLIRS